MDYCSCRKDRPGFTSIIASIQNGSSALLWAAKSGHVQAFQFLLEEGSYPDPVMVEEAKKLLTRHRPGEDGRRSTALFAACRKHRLEVSGTDVHKFTTAEARGTFIM